MPLLKACFSDTRKGFAEHRYIIAALIVYLLCRVVSFLLIVHGSYSSGIEVIDKNSFSLMDVLVFLNRGMDEYEPAANPFFVLDVTWMIPLLLIGLSACLRPVDDIGSYSIQTVSRMGSRLHWYFSKLVWTLLYVFLYYLAMFIFTFVAVAVFGDISLDSVTAWTDVVTGIDGTLAHDGTFEWAIFLGFVATLTTALLLTCLTLAMGPVQTYFTLMILLVLSAYFNVPYLPFGFVMVVRTSTMLTNGFALLLALGICFFVMSASIAGGLRISKKVEYL
jgi:hypothetical protein